MTDLTKMVPQRADDAATKQALAIAFTAILISRDGYNPGNDPTGKYTATHACDLVEALDHQFKERKWE